MNITMFNTMITIFAYTTLMVTIFDNIMSHLPMVSVAVMTCLLPRSTWNIICSLAVIFLGYVDDGQQAISMIGQLK